MTIKKITIQPGCVSCGLCEFIEPRVFELKDTAHVKDDAPLKECEETIKQAAQSCPMQVITYEEE